MSSKNRVSGKSHLSRAQELDEQPADEIYDSEVLDPAMILAALVNLGIQDPNSEHADGSSITVEDVKRYLLYLMGLVLFFESLVGRDWCADCLKAPSVKPSISLLYIL